MPAGARDIRSAGVGGARGCQPHSECDSNLTQVPFKGSAFSQSSDHFSSPYVKFVNRQSAGPHLFMVTYGLFAFFFG